MKLLQIGTRLYNWVNWSKVVWPKLPELWNGSKRIQARVTKCSNYYATSNAVVLATTPLYGAIEARMILVTCKSKPSWVDMSAAFSLKPDISSSGHSSVENHTGIHPTAGVTGRDPIDEIPWFLNTILCIAIFLGNPMWYYLLFHLPPYGIRKATPCLGTLWSMINVRIIKYSHFHIQIN